MRMMRISRSVKECCRHFCSKVETPKKYNDIPGPRGFLGLGTLFLNYRPVFGTYSWDKMHESCMDKYMEYGPIVKERLLPGVDLLFLFDPNDIAQVMNSKIHPERKSHLALLKYRKSRPDVYRTGGLLPTNGETWWSLRSELQKGLSAPVNVRNFFPTADGVVKEFVENCVDHRLFILDLLPDLERLNLELVCLMAFDVRMNAFQEEERHDRHSRCNRLIEAAKISNSSILPMDQGVLWKFFETPMYKKFKRSQEYMEQVAIDLVTQKLTYYHEGGGTRSLLDGYLQNPNLHLQDIVGMACDLLLAGVDTSTYTTSYALYHLGRNLDVQQKVYEEAKRVLPEKDGPIEIANFMQATYTRAALRESLRLNPISIGVGRTLTTDMVLSGYSVPKGTVAVVQTQVPSLLEQHFVDANKFNPERWLRDQNGQKAAINPYVSLPFGHGMRACIARRFAEQNIMLFLLRLIRKYEVKWMGEEEISYSTKLINVPDQRISIGLKERD